MDDLNYRLKAINEEFIKKFTKEEDKKILKIIQKMDEIEKDHIIIEEKPCKDEKEFICYSI